MKFKQLILREWKQFQEIDLEFHPRLTILAGANGSGKTTILNLLARHFGWDFVELATPAIDKKTGHIKYFARDAGAGSVGEIVYDDNERATIRTPPDKNIAPYSLEFSPKRFPGVNIPSHKYMFNYSSIASLGTTKVDNKQAYQLVSDSSKRRLLHGGESPASIIKKTLLGWAVYGYGNQAVEPDQEQVEFYEGFIEILRKILPNKIGFQGLVVRKMEVVFVTDSGEFILDAVSGGIAVLIDLAWQIFFQTKGDSHYTVLIDEVENHLHPTMQRSILSDLLEAFPNVQFIVSTHSPLVVGSVKESHVYTLRYNESNRVFSEKLDLTNSSRSATDILREVLGVPFSMPIWVEEQLNQIVEKYSTQPFDENIFSDMRKELNAIGLSKLVPQAIVDVAGRIE